MTATVSNDSAYLHVSYNMSARVVDADVMPRRYQTGRIRPNRIRISGTATYKATEDQNVKARWTTVYVTIEGPLIRKDGSNGMVKGTIYDLDEMDSAPEWVQDFVKTNPLPSKIDL